MSSSQIVEHYGHEQPIDRIRAQLSASGFDLQNLKPDDLTGVDEFHLGGHMATLKLLNSATLTSESKVLDVGSGIGGAARTVSTLTGCHVTGVDLTPVFVETATKLSELVGMSSSTSFEVANATKLPFDDGQFDAVTLLHVGMNIKDKTALFAELGRVLNNEGSLHVYDIMRVGDDAIDYPMPWSSVPTTSFVQTSDQYVTALTAAGLATSEPANRLGLVRTALQAAKENPQPVNLSHLMGPNWPTMFGNLSKALGSGTLAPVEIVARRST